MLVPWWINDLMATVFLNSLKYTLSFLMMISWEIIAAMSVYRQVQAFFFYIVLHQYHKSYELSVSLRCIFSQVRWWWPKCWVGCTLTCCCTARASSTMSTVCPYPESWRTRGWRESIWKSSAASTSHSTLKSQFLPLPPPSPLFSIDIFHKSFFLFFFFY